MPRETKKHAATQTAEEKPKSLEQMMLDKTQGKYALVSLASAWALELRKKEENRHLSQQEILDLALTDLLAGKVSPDEVRKAAEETALANAAQADGKLDKK